MKERVRECRGTEKTRKSWNAKRIKAGKGQREGMKLSEPGEERGWKGTRRGGTDYKEERKIDQRANLRGVQQNISQLGGEP